MNPIAVKPSYLILMTLALVILPNTTWAETCVGFGPQTPRDIDSPAGDNRQSFSLAPDSRQMNLCNIHFHKNAEHKAKDFSQPAEGNLGGFRCNGTPELSTAELAGDGSKVCTNIEPGDTIEVHWVYSSCQVAPGPTLGACSSETCANPTLRVETQVFLLVTDPSARDFADFAYGRNMVDGRHQPKSLPSDTGVPVRFRGSTTGPNFSRQTCSPLQVTWNVRPQCAKLNIASLARWCKKNVFCEHYGHGVRDLVTSPELLSVIE